MPIACPPSICPLSIPPIALRTMPTTKPSTHPRTVPIVASCSVTPRPHIKSGPYFSARNATHPKKVVEKFIFSFLPYVSNYVNNNTKRFTFQYFIATNCLFLLFCVKFCDPVYLFCLTFNLPTIFLLCHYIQKRFLFSNFIQFVLLSG